MVDIISRLDSKRIDTSMALRIEKAFGVKMDTLMRMQSSYDIARTRDREGELDVEPYPPAADETDYLLRSPANAKRLREAIARADSGEGDPWFPPTNS